MHKLIGLANYLIADLTKHKICIGYVKLQKMLYLCQGHHLFEYAEPFFDEDVLAWPCGPAIAEIKDKYEIFNFKAEHFNNGMDHEPTDIQKETINHVRAQYGNMNRDEIVATTKSHLIYIETFERWRVDPLQSNIISKESIKTFFAQLQN
ncbi:MAG: DUF4065 domain-containing protein [Defluviitaleaceae bacterium]|nr:DUF4065 domain-containing protein [Defluviitaleaceae bacterium]